MSNVETIIIKPNEVNLRAGGYNYTKVKNLKILENNKEVYNQEKKTWASTIRDVVEVCNNYMKFNTKEESQLFENTFNNNLNDFLNGYGLKENSNFSRKIFIDDKWMTSSVYKSNTNHTLCLFVEPETNVEKYICAVYSGEVIWVIVNLIQTLKDVFNMDLTVEIEFFDNVKPGQMSIEGLVNNIDTDDVTRLLNPNKETYTKSEVEQLIRGMWIQMDYITRRENL